MKKNTPSMTAELAAALRFTAARSSVLRRIVNDPYAGMFCGLRTLPALVFNIVLSLFDKSLSHVKAPMIQAGVLCALVRHRFLEDELVKLIECGVRQVIIIGAGYDTKSIRLNKENNVKFYELDHPATQGRKRNIIARRKINTQGCTFIPCDMSEMFPSECCESGVVDKKEHVAVVAEGVLSYFTKERMDALIKDLGQLSDSVYLLFDYRHPLTETKGAARTWYSHFKRMGEKYQGLLTCEEMDKLLEKNGFIKQSSNDLFGLSEKYGLHFSGSDLKGNSEVIVAHRKIQG